MFESHSARLGIEPSHIQCGVRFPIPDKMASEKLKSGNLYMNWNDPKSVINSGRETMHQATRGKYFCVLIKNISFVLQMRVSELGKFLHLPHIHWKPFPFNLICFSLRIHDFWKMFQESLAEDFLCNSRINGKYKLTRFFIK